MVQYGFQVQACCGGCEYVFVCVLVCVCVCLCLRGGARGKERERKRGRESEQAQSFMCTSVLSFKRPSVLLMCVCVSQCVLGLAYVNYTQHNMLYPLCV